MDLSIVIPIFNEENKIRKDIQAASEFLKRTGLSGEIIIVDDGSQDHSKKNAEDVSVDPGIQKRVIAYEQNKGKGYAVCEGMKVSKGKYVMFADSGMCIPFDDALKGIDLIKRRECVLANGSRRHAKSNIKRQKGLLRLLLSALFRHVAYFFIGIPRSFTDTQCGFKVYDGNVARELYSECRSEGFSFDVEIICRALQKGYIVKEFPVTWKSDPDTRILPHLTALPVIKEFIKIRRVMAQRLKSLRSQKFVTFKGYPKPLNENIDYSKILDPNRRYRILLLSILFFVIMSRLISIGSYPLMDKTEARYAEIAREMVVSDNWITPQLEPGEPFWGKPPLSFWLTALSYKAFGINEFAARLPSVLLGLMTLYLTFIFGRKMKDTIFGLISALILSTTGLFFVNAGSVMTDPALAASVTLSMVAFYMTFTAQVKSAKKLWGYLFFVGLGLGFLAKGPVGWVLTFIPIFLWCIWHKQWKSLLKNFPWVSGSLLTLIIAVPWYLLAEMQTPGFLEYFFIGEHWQRFTVSGWQGDLYGSGHAQPKGMIWLFAIPATMPWIIILVATVLWLLKRKRITKNSVNDLWRSYLILWFLSPIILFTFSSNILIPYIAPSLSAFALLVIIAVRSFKFDATIHNMPWCFSQRAIIPTVALVPIGFLIAVVTFLPIIGQNNSQIKIVNIFNKLSKDQNGLLIYLQPMPQSADFYANGRAKNISAPQEALQEKLHDGNEDFYVIEKNYISNVPPEVFRLTRSVGEYNGYIIRQEVHEDSLSE